MRLHIATDHAGLEFSHLLQEHLRNRGHELVDHGPTAYDPLDDYPSFCIAAARAVAEDWRAGTPSLGIVLGGSGNGEQMAANKVRGVRAALVWNEQTARLAREHNNANVVAIGARQHTREEAIALVEAFLAEPFSDEERHVRRIRQLAEYERDGAIGGLLAPEGPAGPTPVVLGGAGERA
ncbi:MAG: ribose-5-phosphate isomerase [Pseudoclavibacter sp.]|nr:ribose-5-phosphate isomerase [Pseudoclavibacter sp.]